MEGHLKVMTSLTGSLSIPFCACDPNQGGSDANSDHIMADLISERGIMITNSQICDYTIAIGDTDINIVSASKAKNESHTEYNKEVLL